jgi:predicted MPP superfamily phosphohydrolase
MVHSPLGRYEVAMTPLTPERSENAEPVSTRPAPMRLTRRRVLAATAGVIGLGAAGAAATAVYAGAIEPERLVVTRYALTPMGWPAGRKVTLTVIADLHAGEPNMPLPQVRRIVDTANALQSDIVLLLGDYIAHYPFPTEHLPDALWAAELARLKAPLGTWAILGNHDWWHDLAGVRQALADVRIPLLENNVVHVGAPGQRFWIAGLGDQIAYRLGRGRFRGVDDLPGTLAQVDTNDPVLLLAHEPDIFPRVPARVALTLSGHTHGGQIRVPVIWPAFVPSRYGARFAYGHIVEHDRHLIVSGGLGTSIIPARLGVPPEILHITLGA